MLKFRSARPGTPVQPGLMLSHLCPQPMPSPQYADNQVNIVPYVPLQSVPATLCRQIGHLRTPAMRYTPTHRVAGHPAILSNALSTSATLSATDRSFTRTIRVSVSVSWPCMAGTERHIRFGESALLSSSPAPLAQRWDASHSRGKDGAPSLLDVRVWGTMSSESGHEKDALYSSQGLPAFHAVAGVHPE